MEHTLRGLSVALIASVRSAAAIPARAADFDHLERDGNTVVTTNGLAYTIRVDERFELLGELHHTQTSGNREFDVSIAVYVRGKDPVLIRAETLDDRSGVLDYGALPRSTLSALDFAFREQCVPEEASEEVSSNVEARFIEERGFRLVLPFLLTQYLAAAPHGNAEIAISLGRAVESCTDIDEGLRSDIRHRTTEIFNVERMH